MVRIGLKMKTGEGGENKGMFGNCVHQQGDVNDCDVDHNALRSDIKCNEMSKVAKRMIKNSLRSTNSHFLADFGFYIAMNFVQPISVN